MNDLSTHLKKTGKEQIKSKKKRKEIINKQNSMNYENGKQQRGKLAL